MEDPSITVTIAGNDVSSDFVSLRTEQDICRLAQTCEIKLKATSGGHAYNTWDSLVVAINGTNRLTGYVEEAIKSRGDYTIRGMDMMKRATDTFVTEEVRVEEELDAGYWINYWLEEVGITTSGAAETGRTIPQTLPEEQGWIYVNVGDIILECLGYAGGGYVVIVDGNGVARIKEKTISASSHSLSNLLAFSRSQDDSWYRDRAVVFGTTSGSWVDGEWIPGEVTIVAEAPDSPPTYPRTVALSSSYIQSQTAAEDLADDILAFFDEYLDVKRCLITGDESIWLGDSASIAESWSGYNGTGLVTSIETTVDDGGFKMSVSLDEKCGFIWGHGLPYGQIMFAVPGTLSVDNDQAPWFICDVTSGMTLLSTKAAVKTPPMGTAINLRLQTSIDGGVSWTSQHTSIIGAGQYVSAENHTFTSPFLAENTLMRLDITQVGSETAGADLTVAVRIKLGAT